ncbi:MAG: sugar ABC transporter substrate-binding protein [Chloroflexales bacterium]|nr:sugar ABC transporter substrate-binding protein [Chloroflexales bacterium]
MKRQSFTLLLLATLMALILSACGGGAPEAPETPDESPKTASSTDQPTDASPTADSSAATTAPQATSPATSASGFAGTLQFWVLGYQPGGGNRTGQLMDAAVGAFMAANPDITVEIAGYSGDQAGFTKLTQAVQSGQAVDVFRLPSDVLPLLVKDELVASIDEFLTEEDRADMYPNLLQAVSIDGKAYAWPLWVPPVGMYLNLDVFEERGVDPPPRDWTYDQFVEIAKQLTFTRDNGEQVYGYTALIDPGVVNAWPFILGEGVLPLSADNQSYTFNSPEGIAGLQKLVDLALVHEVTPPDFGSQSGADIQTGFKEKKVYAMYSEPSGASSGYQADGLNFDVWPMPIGSSGEPVTAGGIGLISVAASDDPTRLQAGMDLARYLTGPQVAEDVEGFYLAPGARRSISVDDPISKFEPFVEYCYITPIIAEWPQIRTIIHPQIQNAIFGQVSVEEALNGPAEEVNQILSGN